MSGQDANYCVNSYMSGQDANYCVNIYMLGRIYTTGKPGGTGMVAMVKFVT